MKYKATTGWFHSLCVIRSKIVVGPKGKKKYAQGLGLIVGNEIDRSYAGIYFSLAKAKLIQKRINKLVKEMEKYEL